MTAVMDRNASPLELSSAEEARQVRRNVRALAAEVIANSDVLDDVESMVAEGLANALIHGSGVITVTVTTDHARLRVSVWDQGPACKGTCLGQITTDRIDFGRGLAIVEAYAVRWSLTTEAKQTCLWFEVDLESVEAQASPRPALSLGGETRAGGGNSLPPALGSTTQDS